MSSKFSPINKISSVACIVLTKDNPIELSKTLQSILFQDFRENLVIHVVESWNENHSIKDTTDFFSPGFTKKQFSLKIHRIWPPPGIFQSMNEALNLLKNKFPKTTELIFLNSGDRFIDKSSLGNLFSHKRKMQKKIGMVFPAVFGRSKIIASDSLSWIMPDPKVRNLRKWLQYFNPNHQSVLFDARWAYENPYNLDNILIADRAIMNNALSGLEEVAFSDKLISEFYLSGYSSQLPNWKNIKERVNEPDRSPISKVGECLKFLIPNRLKFIYPYLMLFRSKLISFFC